MASEGKKDNKKDDYVDDDLFMGSVPVWFAPTSGETVYYLAENYSEQYSQELIEQALVRQHPLKGLGPDYSHLIVPAIPATDIQVAPHDSSKAVSERLPKTLQNALIKVPEGSGRKGVVPGVASGVRSALLKVDGNWYRLKGCGNNDEGFVLETISRKSHLINIRGSSFQHTTLRELFMTDSINGVVATYGLFGANYSKGYYRYDVPKDPLPKVPRTCVMTRTLGNRRLGDHVLNGLETVLGMVVSGDCESKAHCSLTAAFEKHGGAGRLDNGEVGSTWFAFMAGLQLSDLFSFDWQEAAPASPPKTLGPRWRALWDVSVKALRDFQTQKLLAGDGTPGSVLAFLYWRCGREAGAYLRALHQHGICWGTYNDLMGGHCNAHSNNLAVVEPAFWETGDDDLKATIDQQRRSASQDGDKSVDGEVKQNFAQEFGWGRCFLSILDLDMSFTETSHLFRTEAKDGQKASKDDKFFRNNLGTEYGQYMMALAGYDQISTGVASGVQLSKPASAVKWVLRDLLVAGARDAYQGKADAHAVKEPLRTALHKAAYHWIRLGLLCTVTHIA